jgi:hypothetical protein
MSKMVLVQLAIPRPYATQPNTVPVAPGRNDPSPNPDEAIPVPKTAQAQRS